MTQTPSFKTQMLQVGKWMTINNYTAFIGDICRSRGFFLKGCVIISVSMLSMGCGSCAETIEPNLQKLRDVTEELVRFATEKTRVFYHPKQLSEPEIIDRITALGYTVDAPPVSVATLV